MSSIPPPPPPPPPPSTSLASKQQHQLRSSSSFHFGKVHLHSTPLTAHRTSEHADDNPSSMNSEEDYHSPSPPPPAPSELQRPSQILQNELRRLWSQANHITVTNMTHDNEPSSADTSNNNNNTHHFCQRRGIEQKAGGGSSKHAAVNNGRHHHQHKCRLQRQQQPSQASSRAQKKTVSPDDVEHGRHHHHHQEMATRNNRRTKAIANTSTNNVEPTQVTVTTMAAPSRSGSATGPTPLDGNKKSRCILFSQIYLIVHISLSICLNGSVVSSPPWTPMSLREILLNIHLVYILVASLVFFLLLRCHVQPKDDNDHVCELSEANSILMGATLLSLSELTLVALNIATDCLETELVVLPLLKFAFALFLVHFLWTQTIHSGHIALRNIALAHLVATQLSLWLLSLRKFGSPREHACEYFIDKYQLVVAPKINETIDVHPVYFQPNTLRHLDVIVKPTLQVVSNQFKLLTIFVLLAQWFTNNQSKINFIRAKLSDEEVNGKGGGYPLRGLLYGSFIVIVAIVTVVFGDNVLLRYTSTIFIQLLISIIAMVALVIRGRKKYLNPKYQINILKHHYIIFVTLLFTYIAGFVNVVSALADIDHAHLSVTYHVTLIVQVTLQTCLLRLQGKKLVPMGNILGFLAMSNFALLAIDVSRVATENNRHLRAEESTVGLEIGKTTKLNLFPVFIDADNIANILEQFVTLNRAYSTLILLQFWRLRF